MNEFCTSSINDSIPVPYHKLSKSILTTALSTYVSSDSIVNSTNSQTLIWAFTLQYPQQLHLKFNASSKVAYNPNQCSPRTIGEFEKQNEGKETLNKNNLKYTKEFIILITAGKTYSNTAVAHF